MTPRVMVLTLHAGEAEFARVRSMVAAQEGVSVEHIVFSGLGSAEAHRRLYSTVKASASDFDLFVKVDADMLLYDEATLASIAAVFAEDPELDHAVFSLDDFYTDAPIMGMHVFSPRVRWREVQETLFVDPAPVVPGRSWVCWGPPSPVGSHSPDPSLEQAFMFGVHRAQKAFQRGRRPIRASQAVSQWLTLERVWEAFLRTRDIRRGFALIGADLVWRGDLYVDDGGYRDEEVLATFRLVQSEASNSDEILSRLAPRWQSALARRARRLSALGPLGTIRVGALTMSRALNRSKGDR